MPRTASDATKTSSRGVRKVAVSKDGRPVYEARWSVNGKQHSRRASTVKDAAAYRAAQLQAAERGEWVQPKDRRITVAEWSATWLASLSLKPKSVVDYESIVRVHIAPKWGSTRMAQLSRTEVGTWLNNLTKPGKRGGTPVPLSTSTKRKVEIVFSAMLTAAINDGRLAKHPLHASYRARRQTLTPPVHATKQHRYLTHEQVTRLADATDEHYRPLVYLLAYTGLRINEALALRVRDYDQLHRRITVSRTQSELHGELTYGSPKTHQTRTVPVPSHIQASVAALAEGKGPDALLFQTPSGAPVRYSNLGSRVWAPAVKAAGLAPLTIHDLRHTAASLAVSAGGNVKVVQRMLGHKSATMTLDTYAGLFDSDLTAVAEAMASSALAPAEASNVTPLAIR